MDSKLVLGWLLLGLATVQGLYIWDMDSEITSKEEVNNDGISVGKILEEISNFSPIMFDNNDDLEFLKEGVAKNLVTENKPKKQHQQRHHEIQSNEPLNTHLFDALQDFMMSLEETPKQSQGNTNRVTDPYPEQVLAYGMKLNAKPTRSGRIEEERNERMLSMPELVLVPGDSNDLEEELEKIRKADEKTPFQKFFVALLAAGKKFDEDSQRIQAALNGKITQVKEVERTNEKRVRTVFNVKTVNIDNDNAQVKSVANTIVKAANVLADTPSVPITFNIDTLNVVEKNADEKLVDTRTRNTEQEPCGEIEIVEGNNESDDEDQANQQHGNTAGETTEDPLLELKKILDSGEENPITGKNGGHDKIDVIYNKEGRFLTLIPKKTGENDEEED